MSFPDPYRSAQSGYGAARASTASPREKEADVFLRAITALTRAKTSRRSDPQAFHRALTDNRKLWIHLSAEAATQDNPLPDEVKANILSLSDFVLRHTDEILRKGAEIDPLIEINRAIYRGLSTAVRV